MNATARLAVEWVPLARLHLSPRNPRHNDDAVPRVAASIQRFGWQQPIVARASGEVIAGNARFKAATSLGLAEVPVVWFDGADSDALGYAIADNRTHEFSSWDDAMLAELLQELSREDALEGVGFDDADLARLEAELELGRAPAIEDPGPQRPPAKAVTRTGDVWQLGKHRLLCGDSTKPEDVARVLAGDRVGLLSTDPPYCVDYTGNERPAHNGKSSGKDWSDVYREVDIEDLGAFLDRVLATNLPHVRERAPVYVWHAHVQQPTIAAAFERHGILFHQVLIWVKPVATFGRSYFRWRHEPCAFGWRKGERPQHGAATLDSVWEADWDGKARVHTFHPTSKPTRLFEIPMELHTRAGDAVLEPFNGSGSQLIAAEKLGRRCRALELAAPFVDGTVERWQQATGREATLEGDGRTFAAIAAARARAPARARAAAATKPARAANARTPRAAAPRARAAPDARAPSSSRAPRAKRAACTAPPSTSRPRRRVAH